MGITAWNDIAGISRPGFDHQFNPLPEPGVGHPDGDGRDNPSRFEGRGFDLRGTDEISGDLDLFLLSLDIP